MANLTRIKNNQITDSTILANTKIVPGSIVGSLFNANLTMSSDVTITGNLTVQGSSTYLTVASTNTYVNDPLIVLNNAFTGTNTYDIGLLINRGDQTTTALIWKEANKQFELTYTTDTGTSYGAINNSGYANLKVGNLTVAGITTIADIGAGNLTLSGDLAVNGGDITTTAATASVFNANATTVSAFGAATTLDIGADTGTLTLNNATVTTDGQLVSTRTGSATTGNGQLFLNGSTSNRIDWAAAGTGAPAFTTRTDGTKVVLYPALSGSTVDYAIGVDSATMWSSVPENGSSFNFKWYGAETLVANLSGTGNFTTVGDVAVNGGDLTTTAATFNLIDTDATTVNFAGAATVIDLGATTGTLTINNPTVVGSQTTQDLYNTTATTLNFAGAATTLIMGATTGVANIRNATTNIIGNATVGGTLDVTGNATVVGTLGLTGDVTLAGDLAVNGGDITTTATTFNLLNATATTVNFANAATTINIGATSGNINARGNINVVGSVTAKFANLYSTVGAGVTAIVSRNADDPDWQMVIQNGFGTGVDSLMGRIGAGYKPTTTGYAESYIDFVQGQNQGEGYIKLSNGNSPMMFANVNGVKILPTTISANTASGALVVAGGAGIGGNLWLGGPTVATSATTLNVFNTNATTVNAFGAATTLIVGAATGIANIRNATTNIIGNATVGGTLAVTGNATITGTLDVTAAVTLTDDLAVNGGDLTTTASTFNLLNANATTVDAFKAATDLEFGATSGTLTINNPTVVGTQTTQNLYNTTATTLNIGGAATALNLGASTGNTTVQNNLITTGNLTLDATTQSTNTTSGALIVAGGVGIAKNLNVGGNVVVTGDLTVNGNVTTLNTATLDVEDLNITVAKGAADSAAADGAGLTVDGASATILYTHATTSWNLNKHLIGTSAQFGTTLGVTGDTTLTADLAVNGGDITTTASTFNLLNANATTVDAFKAATDLEFGATSGTLTINNPTVVGTQTTQNLYNTTATTLNFAGATTTLIVGATTGVANLRNATTNIIGNATVGGTLGVTGNVTLSGTLAVTGDSTLTGDLAVNGGDITTTASTATVFNTNATTVSAFGAATTLGIGATSGTTTVNNNLTVGASGKLLTVNGSMIVEGGTFGNVTATQYGSLFARAYGSNAYSIVQAKSNDDTTGLGMQSFTGANGQIYSNSGIEFKVGATVRDLDVPSGGTVYVTISNTGIVTLGNDIVSSTTTQNVFNTVATTVNAFGAATTMILGATTGTANIRNATTNILGNTTILAETDSTSTDTGALVVAGGVGIAKTVHVGGNVYVNSGKRLAVGADLVSNVIYPENAAQVTTSANAYSRIAIQNLSSGTSATSEFIAIADNGSNVANYLATGIASSGFDQGIGIKAGDSYALASGGNLVIAASSDVNITAGGANDNNILVKIRGTAANVSILANAESDSTTTGALTVAGGVGIAKKLRVAGDTILTSDLAVNGGDLTTSAGTFNLIDTDATTVNFAGAATTLDIGATSGTLTINNPTVVGTQSSQDLYNTTATTMNFAGAATTLIVGATTGVANIRNATTNVIGNATVGGTLNVSAGTTINSAQTSDNFVVKGAVATSLIVANSDYGAVVIGGSNASPQLGSTLKINSSDSMLVPVGSTAERPSNTGNIDVTGMVRYSTTVNALEFYNGTDWVSAGSDSTFTIITSEQFTGNGVADTFTLSDSTTTSATMVSINGVVQIPTYSYSITVDQLVFTEIPAAGDLIDVRILTTTQTAGSEVSSSNGFNTFTPTDADGAQIFSGTSAKTLRVTAAPDGTWSYKNGTKTSYDQTVTNIASAATPVVVDSFASADYTTAKYIVQTKNGSSVESMEAVLVQDGSNAYVSTYGIVSSGSGLGTLSANIVSGNVKLYYTSTSVTNSNVKVYTTYIV